MNLLSKHPSSIIGRSPGFLAALEMARRVARSAATILITGESGTGKEVFAKFIHGQSQHKDGPFVAINCSAIPETLLESELFGHAKGAFTGAQDRRVGLFEDAENGTLFLDEIGDLSQALQAKLLRVLQERTIRRVGENQDRRINCRVVSASHKDLAIEVEEGRFREDLYFRLNVIPISIPPLRERKEDLMPLALAFLKKYALENSTSVHSFTPDAMRFLTENSWRGNVRELENTIERAVVLCSGTEITLADFLPTAAGLSTVDSEVPFAGSHAFSIRYGERLPTVDEVTRRYIVYAVEKKGGARDVTAREIGIDRKTLYKRLKSASLVA